MHPRESLESMFLTVVTLKDYVIVVYTTPGLVNQSMEHTMVRKESLVRKALSN